MARTVLASELLTALRENCDIQNDTHASDAELYRILSSALAETWDVIVSSGLAEQYVKNVTFSVTAGTSEYAFATVVSAGDFYKVHQVYVVETSGHLRPVTRINPAEVEAFKTPTTTSSIKLYYIPCAPEISAGSEVIDGFNGWEEHILACAEITVRKKREEDYSGAYRRKQEIESRIQRMSNTDWSGPSRVVRRRTGRRIVDISNSTIACYVVRGGKLELYERDLYGVIR